MTGRVRPPRQGDFLLGGLALCWGWPSPRPPACQGAGPAPPLLQRESGTAPGLFPTTTGSFRVLQGDRWIRAMPQARARTVSRLGAASPSCLGRQG